MATDNRRSKKRRNPRSGTEGPGPAEGSARGDEGSPAEDVDDLGPAVEAASVADGEAGAPEAGRRAPDGGVEEAPSAEGTSEAAGDVLEQAAALEAAGDDASAEALYRELLTAEPGNVRARLRLGMLYERLDQPEKALEQFEAARVAAPDDPQVVTRMGAVYVALRRYDEAERELKRAQRLAPDRAEAYVQLGMISYRRGLYGQAEAELKRAIALEPEHAQAYYYRGEALNQLGRVDEALAMLMRAVELDPENGRAYYTMGILYDRKHLREEAEAMYRKSREVGGR